MERNKLLKQASLVCSLLKYFQLAGIIMATIVLIHWHSDKEFYRNVIVSEDGFISWVMHSEGNRNVAHLDINNFDQEINMMSLASLEFPTIYVLYIQGIVRMILLFFVFSEFGRIIHSVKTLQTFRTENILLFRKIGKYFLVLFWVSAINFLPKGHTVQVSLDFDLTPLILMFAAYILSEIFKEGNRLQEEEQLTI